MPLSEVVPPVSTERDTPRYHKNLLPVVYVVADQAGRVDSPLYGMFSARGKLGNEAPQLTEYFIRQPDDPYREVAIKWDGEWQVT